MNKPSLFKLRGDKPLSKQLNKNLILLLLALLVVAVLLVVSFALTSKTETATNQAMSAGYANADTSKINSLPAGYQDAQKIRSILARGQANPAGISPDMQAQLDALRQQQTGLLQQLAALKNNQGQGMANNPLQQEALSSSIFFAGGAPAAQANANQQNALNAANANKKADASKLPGGPSDSYNQQNMQSAKVDFLNSEPAKDIYNTNAVQYPISKFELQASTVIPAILQSELDSDLPGVITGVVSQNVYDSISGQYLLIPKGSKIMGEYQSTVSYGQSQLQAKFTRIIRPDGSSVTLPSPSPGVDSRGVSGFADDVNNHWGQIIGAGVLMAVFNIPSIIATNQQNNTNSTPVCTPVPNGTGGSNIICTGGQSLGNTASVAALQSVGQAAAQVGSAVAQKSLNIQPTVTIHAGYEFGIIVTKDIVLPPYQTPMQTIPNIAN